MYSSNIIDLTTTKFVFLDIEELRHDTLVDSKTFTRQGTYPGSTIARTFAAIPMDIIPDWMNTKNFKRDYDYYIKYENPLPMVSRLTVKWLDYNGNVLDFNGMERNCFLLRFTCKPHVDPPKEKDTSEDELIKKMQRMIDDAFPPEPPKKPRKWWLYGILLSVILFIVYRVTAYTG